MDQVIVDDPNDILDKPMSYVERQTLGHNIHFLDRDQLLGIVQIM